MNLAMTLTSLSLLRLRTLRGVWKKKKKKDAKIKKILKSTADLILLWKWLKKMKRMSGGRALGGGEALGDPSVVCVVWSWRQTALADT